MKKRICISIAGILVLSLLTGCSAAGQMRKQREQTAREEQHRTEQEEEKEEEEIDPGYTYGQPEEETGVLYRKMRLRICRHCLMPGFLII